MFLTTSDSKKYSYRDDSYSYHTFTSINFPQLIFPFSFGKIYYSNNAFYKIRISFIQTYNPKKASNCAKMSLLSPAGNP